jgi:SAM-dependent methyltransferase
MVMTELRRAHHVMPEDDLVMSAANNGALGAGYHDEYAGDQTYEKSFAEYFCEYYTRDLAKAIWGLKAPYKLLDVGSATGLTLKLFDRLGIEAWGVENSAHIHARTLAAWRHRNILGDVRSLPFEDNSFDFIYDTCLCYLPPEDLDKAISELFRVARKGVFFGGITSDMTREVIERHELFRGVQSLMTTWEWSELFLKHGFRMAINDRKTMERVWRIECSSNEGDNPWYPDMKTMRSCFYTKPPAVVPSHRPIELVRPEALVVSLNRSTKTASSGR